MRSFTTKSGTKKWNKLLSRVTCRYLLFLTLRRCNSVLCPLVSKGKRLRKWDKYLEQPRLDSCTCYLSTHLALYVILQLFPQLRQFLVRRGNFFSSQSSPRVFFLFYFFFLFRSTPLLLLSQFSFLLSFRRVRSILSINYPHLFDINNFPCQFHEFFSCIVSENLFERFQSKDNFTLPRCLTQLQILNSSLCFDKLNC